MKPKPDAGGVEQLTDDDVVRRIVAGETVLFELLMRRYNQRLYRAARSVVHDDAEAEDVMQQAYLNAYVHLHQFEGRSSFATWLTRIAINEALARVHPRGPRLVDDMDESIMENLESHEPNPEARAAASELHGIVEAEIAALPESYRTVLMLREVEGLSTAEAAACLGVQEDLVKTRLHRARTILRDNLYRHAGQTFEGVFTFGQARCDKLVAAVIARLTTS